MIKREATWMLLIPFIMVALGLLVVLVLPASLGRTRHHESAPTNENR